MNRTLSLALVLSLVAGLCTPAARAQESPLTMIPADTAAFVCVQNLKQMDDRVGQVLQQLGLSAMLPIRSMVTALREYGPLGDGLNETGPIALVMLTPETIADAQNRAGVIVSATDAAALLASMNPTAGEDGVSSVMFFGAPSYAKVKGTKHLVICPTAEAAKALAAAEGSVLGKLQDTEKTAISNLDLVFWLDGEKGAKLVEPMMKEFTATMDAMMAQGGDPNSTKMMQQSIDELMAGLASGYGGMQLDTTGLALRFGMRLRDGSELARLNASVTPADSSLLAGLPQDPFIFAAGQKMSAEQATKGAGMLATMFDNPQAKGALGEENAGKLKDALNSMYGMMRGMSMSFAALPPGPDGLIGATVLVTVSDSAEWTGKLAGCFDMIKSLKPEDPEAAAALAALSYTKDAGTINDTAYHEIALAVDKMEEIDEEQVEELKKVIGNEGPMLRVAAVDTSHVVINFGGGKERFGNVVAAAKAGKSTLDKDAGVRRVAERLPSRKVSEFYLAVDRIVGLIRNITEATGDADTFPLRMPEINAPLAAAATGDKSNTVMDIYVPMELIVAVKDASMQMMGMMMGGGMQPQEPPTDEGTPDPSQGDE